MEKLRRVWDGGCICGRGKDKKKQKKTEERDEDVNRLLLFQPERGVSQSAGLHIHQTLNWCSPLVSSTGRPGRRRWVLSQHLSTRLFFCMFVCLFVALSQVQWKTDFFSAIICVTELQSRLAAHTHTQQGASLRMFFSLSWYPMCVLVESTSKSTFFSFSFWVFFLFFLICALVAGSVQANE